MQLVSRPLFIVLLLVGLAVTWPALAQQSVVESGRQFAPPMPALRTTAPAAPALRQWAPPLPTDRATAPPMPPIVTFPLPSPCRILGRLCDDTPAMHQYVSFGDSLAVGLAAVRGYVPRYEQALERQEGKQLQNRNFARRGMTSGELAQQLAHDATAREALAFAEVVTWNIGGNDFLAARELYYAERCGGIDNQDCLRATLVAFQQNWDQIVFSMNEVAGRDSVLIVTMDLYNPFVRQDPALLQAYWRAANAHIARSSAAADIPVAPVSVAFNGPDGTLDPNEAGYISFDDFHPNDRGHEVLAQALLSVSRPVRVP